VEFALVMTVILPMIVGVVDAGRMFYQSIIIHEAAQAGAHVAAVIAYKNAICISGTPPASINDCGNKLVYQAIENAAPTWFPIVDSDITITPADGTAWAGGQAFTITVAKTFNPFTPLWSGMGDQVMRARVSGTRCDCL